MAKCGNDDNVWEHVDQLCYMFEEQSSMGVAIPESQMGSMLPCWSSQCRNRSATTLQQSREHDPMR